MHPGVPELSIVVPTRDRPASLARCLRALERQTAAGRLEIVVVDDGSELRRTIAEIAAGTRQSRLRRLEGRGPAAARNAGVEAARAPIVCFLDDDCEPEREWADTLTAALGPDADVVAGTTVNPRPADSLAAASQAIADFRVQPSAPGSEYLDFARTCNLACAAELVRTIPFDESYAHPRGEERDWCARVLAAGFRIVHEPRAVVLHRPELSLGSFCRQQFRGGQGAHRFRRSHGDGRAQGAGPAALVRRGFGEGVTAGLLVCLAQVASAAGYAYAAVDREREGSGSAGGSP